MEAKAQGSELAAVFQPPAERQATWKQALRFALVGGSGYLINLAVFFLLAGELGIPHSAAALAAFCVAVTNNFLCNRRWTFSQGQGRADFQAARFFLVSVVALGLNLAVLEVLLRSGAIGELAAQASAVAAATPFNFFANKLWTFA